MLLWAAATAAVAAAAASGSPTQLQDGKPLVPPWPATYQMNLSTIIQPCNDSGPFDPAFGSRFGVADYDWSNMKQVCGRFCFMCGRFCRHFNLCGRILPDREHEAADVSKFDTDRSRSQVWVNTKPMDCEKLLVTQAELNRKINPKSRAFVYRNLVKALNWPG